MQSAKPLKATPPLKRRFVTFNFGGIDIQYVTKAKIGIYLYDFIYNHDQKAQKMLITPRSKKLLRRTPNQNVKMSGKSREKEKTQIERSSKAGGKNFIKKKKFHSARRKFLTT